MRYFGWGGWVGGDIGSRRMKWRVSRSSTCPGGPPCCRIEPQSTPLDRYPQVVFSRTALTRASPIPPIPSPADSLPSNRYRSAYPPPLSLSLLERRDIFRHDDRDSRKELVSSCRGAKETKVLHYYSDFNARKNDNNDIRSASIAVAPPAREIPLNGGGGDSFHSPTFSAISITLSLSLVREACLVLFDLGKSIFSISTRQMLEESYFVPRQHPFPAVFISGRFTFREH